MIARLEHANLTVTQIEPILQFLKTAFPEFQVRGQGIGNSGEQWLHFGNDETYVALMTYTNATRPNRQPYSNVPGLNHLAYVVDDTEGLRKRLNAAGYPESTPPNHHPHRRRVYFRDPDNNDWEFVQYLSDKASERNDYLIGE